MSERRGRRTLTHWGAYDVHADAAGTVSKVEGFALDPDASPIGQSLRSYNESRVRAPSIRRSWLEHGPGAAPHLRGQEPFVEVSWDRALDLLAAEIERVKAEGGSESIFAGSYGWSSAGRFHHAQSQLHRFMNLAGGYTRSVNTYSLAAAEVILPHVIGLDWWSFERGQNSWSVIAEHTETLVCLGGVPLKNAQVQSGGIGRHRVAENLRRCRERGVAVLNVSPLRADIDEQFDAEWIPIKPGTDTALVLGLLHTVTAAGWHDEEFLARYCTGWEPLRAYVLGEADGVAKDAAWAAGITGVPAEQIRALAERMVTTRSLITASWSIQRADHGEHAYWSVIALAAAIGQIGLPGGGFGFGYGAVGTIGNGVPKTSIPALPQGRSSVETFIPVARIADLLLNPGATFDYNGRRATYPLIKLIYWAGGNPFHHHMDLNRLREAWTRPETVVVNEPFWTATARFADIVLPATTPLERIDLGGSTADGDLFAMQQVAEPYAQAQDDYAIFAQLAERLGFAEQFTEGRTSQEWVRHLYDQLATAQPEHYPPFEEFWELAHVANPLAQTSNGDVPEMVLFADFRADPDAHPLRTASGRITLFSPEIADFGYADCPPHPTWMPPAEWLAESAPPDALHLLSNQPREKLHSQYDHGEVSRKAKVNGREPLLIHPDDAAERGIADGQVVLVRNERGACHAGTRFTPALRRGVVLLATGAWYDPDPEDGWLCRHGNPNVLTRDVGTSQLAQGPSAQTCLVWVEPVTEPLPDPQPFRSPDLLDESAVSPVDPDAHPRRRD